MSARKGSVAMFLVKWLVIPVGLAALGFFFVGPMLAGKPEAPAPEKAPVVVEEGDGKSSGRKFIGEPQVKVSARPLSNRRSTRRSARRKPPEAAAPRPEDVPSPDEEPPRSGPDGN